MSEELKRTYNPCDECPYGIEKRDGSGNDSTCKICEFADLVKANRRAQQPNEPLTLDELRKMDRKSVYCVGYNEIVLVYIDEHSDLWITFANGDRLTARSCIDSAACKFFARPPEAGEKE